MGAEGKRLTVKTAPIVVAASLALAMGVLAAPGSALAQRAQGVHDSGLVAGGTTLGVSRSVAAARPSPVTRSAKRAKRSQPRSIEEVRLALRFPAAVQPGTVC